MAISEITIVLEPVKFLVARDWNDETTLAEVTANVPTHLRDEQRFRAALQLAVTDWIVTTPEGRKAWEYSGGDFNIGDLACQPIDAGLGQALARQQIHNLEIETFGRDGFCQHWVYDTVLGDSAKIEDALRAQA